MPQSTSSLAIRFVLPAAISLACIGSVAAQKPAAVPEAERYVHPGGKGLVYQAGPRGDRIADFSVCGYRDGGFVLPDTVVQVAVSPIDGDNTARIQAAIDYVSQLPAGEHGLRGAVLVKKGRHLVAGTLQIRAGGVVLRGEGDGNPDSDNSDKIAAGRTNSGKITVLKDENKSETAGTVLVATGTDRRPLIRIFGKNDQQPAAGRHNVTEYVPVGGMELKLDNSDGLKIGDTIIVERPGTAAWVKLLG